MKEQFAGETRAARRERWRMLILEAEASGESIRAFCLKRGILESQYHYWKQQFRGEQDPSATPGRRGFVFVGTAGPMQEQAALELVVERGWRLRIGSAVEERALRTVLAALAEQA